MNSRQRVLEVLAGRTPDRVPVAFEFAAAGPSLRAEGIADPDAHFGVDLKKIWFQPAAPPGPAGPPGLRTEGGAWIGDEQQVNSYRLWNYAPQRIDRRSPLLSARGRDDLDRHPFPTLEAPGEAERLRRAVAAEHAGGYAVAGQIPYLGGVIFETAYRLRGLDNLLEDLHLRPDFAEALLDRITDNAARNARQLAAAGADIVFLGDDIGMPTSMLLSPAMWRRWFKPRLARVIEAARAAQPGVPVAYHSDGWFWPVLDDLADIGVGILNPVQPDCMDPLEVRRRFGRRLTLWGTVGRATLLPFGTAEEIRREVRRRVEELSPGGLILSPAYDLEENTPPRNVRAFFAAAREKT